MIYQNLHTHTIYDDGKNTPQEMAEAALRAGLTSLGFSGHSVLPYENDWAMTAQSCIEYNAAVEETREEYRGRLTVLRGIEWDHTSALPEGYDYIIGSVHHLPAAARSFTVDETRDHTLRALTEHFHGDKAAFAEAYFAEYDALARVPTVDIVGHFDLLTKFDEPEPIFNDGDAVYFDAAIAAMEALLQADKLFEVNTGAISRGYRTAPYPSVRLLRELKARNARVLVTADAHSADAIACAFPETEALLKSLGFRETWELTEAGFVPRALG